MGTRGFSGAPHPPSKEEAASLFKNFVAAVRPAVAKLVKSFGVESQPAESLVDSPPTSSPCEPPPNPLPMASQI